MNPTPAFDALITAAAADRDALPALLAYLLHTPLTFADDLLLTDMRDDFDDDDLAAIRDMIAR